MCCSRQMDFFSPKYLALQKKQCNMYKSHGLQYIFKIKTKNDTARLGVARIGGGFVGFFGLFVLLLVASRFSVRSYSRVLKDNILLLKGYLLNLYLVVQGHTVFVMHSA